MSAVKVQAVILHSCSHLLVIYFCTGVPVVSETIYQWRLSVLGHLSRMPPSADAYKAIYPKTFLRTGGDDLVDLDSPGCLPYTEICGNSILTWTMFLNLLPIVYCGGRWFVALRTTLVHATDDSDPCVCDSCIDSQNFLRVGAVHSV